MSAADPWARAGAVVGPSRDTLTSEQRATVARLAPALDAAAGRDGEIMRRPIVENTDEYLAERDSWRASR